MEIGRGAAAECIAQAFGSRGKMYRIGGDEFVVLLHADADGQAACYRTSGRERRRFRAEAPV